jgi:hypothetical protein
MGAKARRQLTLDRDTRALTLFVVDCRRNKGGGDVEIKSDLEEAEKTYNEMMSANLEFIEEDAWELLREKVISSLQLSKAHNTHAMTWGQAGRCIADDGRAT